MNKNKKIREILVCNFSYHCFKIKLIICYLKNILSSIMKYAVLFIFL